MEKKIIKILNEADKPLSAKEINNLLEMKTLNDFKKLLKILVILENKSKVYFTKSQKYILFERSHFKTGKLMVNKKGFGFVRVQDEEIYIHESNLNGSIHGDEVIVDVIKRKGFQIDGKIIKIIKRELRPMVGELIFSNNKYLVKLDNEQVKLTIEVNKKNLLGAVVGHKVLVKLIKKIKNNYYIGTIIKIIGHKFDPGVDVLSIAYKYEINDVFPEVVLAEVQNIKEEVLEEEIKLRKDLRDELIFTIDGLDVKDIDDALSLKVLKNGNYLLGVHIADVSYYVNFNSEIDKEAYSRGTSVYLADRVIPMIPHKLSNGICSLNPLVDRLAITCEMEINNNGEVVNYNIFESVIQSKKQMVYDDINLILEKDIVPKSYENFVDVLKNMKKLALILRKNKIRRGYIDFEIDEPKIVVNNKGRAIDVVLRNRGIGEKIIEDFMIVANETVAQTIYHLNLPFIYRVHDKPKEEKIKSFLDFIKILGYRINLKKPFNAQNIINELHSKKEFPILSRLMLRSMEKAIYDYKNIGHFGLGSKCYTHFTSPIRRYPDLIVHRLLRIYLFKQKLDNNTINYWERELVNLTEHVSLKERNAIECEREVVDMKQAEYMETKIGHSYTGIISGVMSFGLFIELPNLIEGLIKIEDLKDDYYIFDEATFSLKGVRKNKRYRLGDKIKVIVKGASKKDQTIDFIIDKGVLNDKCKK